MKIYKLCISAGLKITRALLLKIRVFWDIMSSPLVSD